MPATSRTSYTHLEVSTPDVSTSELRARTSCKGLRVAASSTAGNPLLWYRGAEINNGISMKEFLAHIRQNLDISRFPPRVTTLNGFPELSSRNEYF
jgi:hypothetical protein